MVFMAPYMSVFMLLPYVDLHDSSYVFSLPIWLMCSCFSTLSCSGVGIIICLPLIAVLSMTVISFLRNQYCCSLFCTLAFVDGQLWSMGYVKVLRCLSFRLNIFISSTLMQTGMPLHDSIALILTCICSISSFLFVLLLYLGSQSTMNSCGPG